MAQARVRYDSTSSITYKAAQDVIAGRLVELQAAGSAQHAAAGSEKVLGVAMYDAATGEYFEVRSEGIVELEASSAVSVGSLLVADADGKVVAYSGSSNNPNQVIGLAESDSDANQKVWVRLYNH